MADLRGVLGSVLIQFTHYMAHVDAKRLTLLAGPKEDKAQTYFELMLPWDAAKTKEREQAMVDTVNRWTSIGPLSITQSGARTGKTGALGGFFGQ